jgi:acetyl esterase/lipase
MRAWLGWVVAMLATSGCSSGGGVESPATQPDDAAGGAGSRVLSDASPGHDVALVPAPDVATFDVAETGSFLVDGGVDVRDPFANYQPIIDGGLQEINLYAGDPPNLRKDAPPETVGAGGRIYSVSVPTLRRYPMNPSQATGIGFIVFPGGGYDHLDIERHATALALRMGPTGIAVFGLKYRVGTGSTDVERDALLDAKRAVRLVRAHASEWGVVPDRLGIVSYSAGSHLSLTLSGKFDAGQPNDADPVERESSRPSFSAAMCSWAHGSTTSPFTFLASTPPLFMCHAQDDTTAPIAMAMQVEKQLQALKVLVHLEIYPTGGHDAFNVGEAVPGRDWPDKLMPWLRSNAIVP